MFNRPISEDAINSLKIALSNGKIVSFNDYLKLKLLEILEEVTKEG